MMMMKRKKTNLSQLMEVEKKLLEIESVHVFELDFQEAITLRHYLSQIGKITEYAFELQRIYSEKGASLGELQEYHDKISNGTIYYDCERPLKFMEKLLRKYKWSESKNNPSENSQQD